MILGRWEAGVWLVWDLHCLRLAVEHKASRSTPHKRTQGMICSNIKEESSLYTGMKSNTRYTVVLFLNKGRNYMLFYIYIYIWKILEEENKLQGEPCQTAAVQSFLTQTSSRAVSHGTTLLITVASNPIRNSTLKGLRGYSVCLQCGRPGFHPWVGKIPWRRKWQPTEVLLPGESHGRRSLVGYSPRRHKELDTTERLHFHETIGWNDMKLMLLYYFEALNEKKNWNCWY